MSERRDKPLRRDCVFASVELKKKGGERSVVGVEGGGSVGVVLSAMMACKLLGWRAPAVVRQQSAKTAGRAKC